MASAEDVTKWLRHLLHNLDVKDGDTGVNLLIGNAFARTSEAPDRAKKSTLQHDSETIMGYGMGWQETKFEGQRCYKYSGQLYGYSSRIWLFPKTRAAIFLAANGLKPLSSNSQGAVRDETTLPLEAILYYISDIVHRRTPWLKQDKVCEEKIGTSEEEHTVEEYDYPYSDVGYPKPIAMLHVKYPHPQDSYEGSYGNGLVGDFVIERNDEGVLTMSVGNNLRGNLLPDESSPSRLKLDVVGDLANTDEWVRKEHFVEFLPHRAPSTVDSRKFESLRLYDSDTLFYEFERGKKFSTMLIEAEEAERRMLIEEEEHRIKQENEIRRRQEEERKAKVEAERKAREEALKREREQKAKMEAGARAEQERIAAAKRAEEEQRLRELENARTVAVVETPTTEQNKEMIYSTPDTSTKDQEFNQDAKVSTTVYGVEDATEVTTKINHINEIENIDSNKIGQLTTHREVEIITENNNQNSVEDTTIGSNENKNEYNNNISGKHSSFSSHQNHQPYSVDGDEQSETATNLEELPPEKAASPGGRSVSRSSDKAASQGAKDGAGRGALATSGLLVSLLIVTVLHRLL